MTISETCPECGAERLSYMGGSHFRQKYGHNTRVCCDGLSPDEAWQGQYYSTWMGRPRHWPVS